MKPFCCLRWCRRRFDSSLHRGCNTAGQKEKHAQSDGWGAAAHRGKTKNCDRNTQPCEWTARQNLPWHTKNKQKTIEVDWSTAVSLTMLCVWEAAITHFDMTDMDLLSTIDQIYLISASTKCTPTVLFFSSEKYKHLLRWQMKVIYFPHFIIVYIPLLGLHNKSFQQSHNRTCNVK